MAAGGKKSAQISVGVEGAQEAANELGKMFDAPSAAAEKFFGNLGTIGNLATRTISLGIESAVAAFDKLVSVDVSKATEGLINMSRETTRMAQYFNRGAGEVRYEAMKLGRSLGIGDDQASKLISTFAKMTNTTGDNTAVLEGLGGEALLTGHSIEELAAKGAELHNRLGVPLEQLPDLFAGVRAAAVAMNTTGGPRALHDDLAAVANVLVNVRDGAKNVTPLLAAIGKSNLTPEQRKEAATRLVSYVTTNVEPLRRQLGVKQADFYDAEGRIKADPTALLLKLQQDAIKRYGGKDAARRVMMQDSNLGPLAGAALFNLDERDVRNARQQTNAQREKARRAAEEAADRVYNSPAEQVSRRRQRKESLQREIVGRMGFTLEEGSPEYENWVRNHPLVRSGLTTEGAIRGVAETGKFFTDKTIGMNRLLGLMGAGDIYGLADKQEELEQARRRGRATISAMRGGPAGTAAPEAQPTSSAATTAAPDTLMILDAIKALANRPVEAKVAVDVVNATGAPEGSISAYQSGQTRQ